MICQYLKEVDAFLYDILTFEIKVAIVIIESQSINLGNHMTMVGGDFQDSRMGGGNQDC